MGEAAADQETEEAFFQRITPELEQIEVMREVKLAAYLSRQKMIWPLGVAVIACTLALDYFLTHHLFKSSFPIFPFCSVLAGFGLFIWMGKPQKDYVSIYKDNITPRIAKLVGLDIYQREGMIPISDMKDSRILPGFQNYWSEDYFEGRHRGARIRFAQVRFEARKRAEGLNISHHHSTRRDGHAIVFRGLALVINIPSKPFEGHTILVKDKDRFSEWITAKLTGLDAMPLPDPSFDKMFSIFSDNRAEAGRLIDSAMLARVAELQKVYRSQGVSVAFCGPAIVMLIAADKDFFEPANIATPATGVESVRMIRRELQEIFKLIDDCGFVK